MSKQFINFVARVGDGSDSLDAIATIWPVTRDAEGFSPAEAPIVRNFPISLSPSESKQFGPQVSIPEAGQYLVDVRFSNGRRTRRTVNVVAASSVEFPLWSEHFPIAKYPPTERATRGSTRTLTRTQSAQATTESTEIRVMLLEDAGMICNTLYGLDEVAKVLKSKTAEGTWLDATLNTASHVQLQIPDRSRASFKQPDFVRSWACIYSTNGPATLVACPVPWDTGNGHLAKLELWLEKCVQDLGSNEEAKSVPAWNSQLKLKDAQFGAIVEYLTRRDLEASAALFESALELLVHKVRNPFAAAAGAYVYALNPSIAYTEESSNWPNWIANLGEWFPWLPDGLIALAWIQLRSGQRGRSSWMDARTNFLQAAKRGLPYYSLGLRMLSDGLLMLSMSEQRDDEVAEALRAVQRAHSLVNQSEPFTTIRIHQMLEGP